VQDQHAEGPRGVVRRRQCDGRLGTARHLQSTASTHHTRRVESRQGGSLPARSSSACLLVLSFAVPPAPVPVLPRTYVRTCWLMSPRLRPLRSITSSTRSLCWGRSTWGAHHTTADQMKGKAWLAWRGVPSTGTPGAEWSGGSGHRPSRCAGAAPARPACPTARRTPGCPSYPRSGSATHTH
jgi:hypothetical protein